MKRKRIGIIVSGILVCCLGVGFYLWNQKQPPGEVVIDAKVDGYDSLEEIEDKVSIIVKAKKVSENPSMIRKNGEENIRFTGTIGNVEILEIYKNTSGKDLKISDEIPILENEAYNKAKNVVYHVAGYRKMEQDKEYMLFLDYSEDDGWYVPCSAIWGKYPLDANEMLLFQEKTTRANYEEKGLLDGIQKEVLGKYGK